ncbi:restriction endonuclease subunit S [Azotobacter bryophylli]|uniref:Restriction endonuclease subunit S n=1 Tax=Azotobacter bryophylli TaxID=1986537 RepID=A0ABV7ARF4_9GAMM
MSQTRLQNWHNVTIQDLGQIVTGRTPPSSNPEMFGGEYPFITPSDMSFGLRRVSTERSISNIGSSALGRIKLPPKSVAFVCIGATIGKVCLTYTESFTNQQINSIIVNCERYSPEFVYYLMLGIADEVKALAGGAATPIINKSSFCGISVSVPPIETQLKIASILSVYDDFIENNTRRIEILEEKARRLYEEWFVQFRFPGHEEVELKESELGLIPATWEIATVGDAVGRISTGPKYCQRTVSVSGSIPVLDQGKQGVIGYHSDEPGVWASLSDPVIVFSNHTCYQKIILHPFSTIQNVLPFKSSDKYKRDIYWLHNATYGVVELNDYKGHWPQFTSKKIIVAEEQLTARFGRLAEPIYHLIFSLQRKNNNLRKQRDLLLPKLISGEIDVSEVPMPN